MSGRRKQRFVVAAPAGVRIRTRLRPTGAEAEALTAVGMYLGALYRSELAARVQAAALSTKEQAEHRAIAKKRLTASSSSRWAGALTRTVEDQYQLGMRGLHAHAEFLDAACRTIAARIAVPPGTRIDGVAGYRDTAERFQKSRRLAVLRHRAVCAHYRLQDGSPHITVGGKRLWRTRNSLAAAGLDEPAWRRNWDAARMFLTADGESGKRWGNETITLTGGGDVRIKVPVALSGRYGTHLHLSVPAMFTHQRARWLDRVSEARAVRYDITFNPAKGRWYLDASWGEAPAAPPSLDEAGNRPILGVDVNDEHLDAAVLDVHGNPVGAGVTVAVEWKNLPASTKDGHLRAALTELLDYAAAQGCSTLAIENLDFADARATGRERMGRGWRGKRFRRTVAGIPTAQFRDRLAAIAAHRGVRVIAVNPRNTSKAAAKFWLPQLNKTSGSATVHQCAAITVGRRAHGFKLSRRVAGPRCAQRSTAGQPAAFGVRGNSHHAALFNPNLDPPPRGDGKPAAEVNTTSDQDRSGHTTEHSPTLSA